LDDDEELSDRNRLSFLLNERGSLTFDDVVFTFAAAAAFEKSTATAASLDPVDFRDCCFLAFISFDKMPEFIVTVATTTGNGVAAELAHTDDDDDDDEDDSDGQNDVLLLFINLFDSMLELEYDGDVDVDALDADTGDMLVVVDCSKFIMVVCCCC
jgi:hypothetical protein